MGEDLKAEAVIELNPDKFVKGSKAIQKEFGNIEKKSTKSLDDVESSFEDVGDEATKTGNKIRQSGQKGESAMNDLGDAAEETERDMAAVGVAALGIADGIGTLSDSIFGMAEKITSVKRAAFGLSLTQRDLGRDTEDLVEAWKRGELSAKELKRAQEDLLFGFRDLKIEEEELVGQSDALTSETFTLALGLGQTLVFSVLAVKAAFGTLTLAQVKNRIVTIASTAASKLHSLANIRQAITTAGTVPATVVATGAQTAMTGSIVATTFSIRALTIAMLSSPLAPFAIAAIGAGAAFAAYETDAFGLRTELGKLAGQELPTLGSAMDDLSGIVFPNAEAEIDETSLGLSNLSEIADLTGISLSELEKAMGNTTDEFEEGAEVLSAYDIMMGRAGETTDNFTKSTIGLSSSMSGVPDLYRQQINSLVPLTKALTEAEKANAKWIKSMEEASSARFLDNDVLGGINPSSSDTVIDPNTGRPKTVPRKRGNVTQSFFDSLSAELKGNFRASNGPGRVLTTGLQRQLADNAARNARKSFIRSAEGKALAKEEKKQKQVFQIQLAGNLGLDISDFSSTGKKTDIGTFTRLFIGPKTKKSLGLLSGMLREARLSEEDALFMSAGELQARISQTKEGRQLAISNDLDVSQVLSNIDSIGSVVGAAQFVNRNTFFQKQSDTLGISVKDIEAMLRGPERDKASGVFSDMLGFENQKRLSVVRT